MKFLKCLFMVTLTQVIVWGMLTLGLLCLYGWDNELSNSTRGLLLKLMSYAIIILPIILPIVYLIKENEICSKLEISKLKLNFIIILSWIIETLLIGTISTSIVDTNCYDWDGFVAWFMTWEFGFRLIILPISIVIITKIIKLVYRKLKTYKTNN